MIAGSWPRFFTRTRSRISARFSRSVARNLLTDFYPKVRPAGLLGAARLAPSGSPFRAIAAAARRRRTLFFSVVGSNLGSSLAIGGVQPSH
jgi:hypothetical protein